MRIHGSVEKVSVLVVIGVTKDGYRMVLAVQSGDKESAVNWRELFKDTKRRGLDPTQVVLGIMDGLPGLEKVFLEEFPNARVQRCQIHLARNVLSKVPRKLKKTIADEVRSIFYASSKRIAVQFFEQFKSRWQKEIPSAVKCLENSLESCLTYLQFPEEEWICLRTSNVIERVNKEFKRRTKPMEIVAGERSCYTLLAFISLKMELRWRSKPIGKDKSRGDAVALEHYRKHKHDITPSDLEVTKEEIKAAYEQVEPNVVDCLKTAAQNIFKFHQAQLEREMWSIEVSDGILAGRITRAMDIVGCYIPGGTAAYPSSVLMTVLPARVAGVGR